MGLLATRVVRGGGARGGVLHQSQDPRCHEASGADGRAAAADFRYFHDSAAVGDLDPAPGPRGHHLVGLGAAAGVHDDLDAVTLHASYNVARERRLPRVAVAPAGLTVAATCICPTYAPFRSGCPARRGRQGAGVGVGDVHAKPVRAANENHEDRFLNVWPMRGRAWSTALATNSPVRSCAAAVVSAANPSHSPATRTRASPGAWGAAANRSRSVRAP